MPPSTRLLLTVLLTGLTSAPAMAQAPLDPPPVTDSAPPAAPAAGGFLDDLFGRFLPRVGYSYEAGDAVGRDGGLSAFQAFLPVWEDRAATGLVFSDSRLLLFDNKGTVGANLGLGGRIFSGYLGRTVGGYVYWDYTDTGRASFNQVSGGFETLGDRVDARANFYVPVSKDRKTTDLTFTPNTDLYFQGNALLLGGGQGWRTVEQALYGFDTEAGLRFFANDSLELRAFAGMYHYQADQAAQAWGPRGRLEARIRDTVAMGLSVQNDRLFGTTVNLNVLMTFPRLSGRSYSDGPAAPLAAGDRLGDPVVRGQQQVAVLRRQEQYVVPGKALVDPLTGQPYVFLHVAPGGNSDGSFENPYGSLAEAFADPRFARGNVVLYDRARDTFAGNVRFAPGTRLLASGPVQMLDTADSGRVRLPFSGASPGLALAPSIQGTVTLASRSVVSGFDFHAPPGSPALAGPEAGAVRDVAVTGNRFTGGGPAVYLTSVTGSVVVAGNRIDSPKGSGGGARRAGRRPGGGAGARQPDHAGGRRRHPRRRGGQGRDGAAGEGQHGRAGHRQRRRRVRRRRGDGPGRRQRQHDPGRRRPGRGRDRAGRDGQAGRVDAPRHRGGQPDAGQRLAGRDGEVGRGEHAGAGPVRQQGAEPAGDVQLPAATARREHLQGGGAGHAGLAQHGERHHDGHDHRDGAGPMIPSRDRLCPGCDKLAKR